MIEIGSTADFDLRASSVICCLCMVGQLQRAERQLQLATDYVDNADNPRPRAALNEQLAAIGRERADRRAGREAQKDREP